MSLARFKASLQQQFPVVLSNSLEKVLPTLVSSSSGGGQDGPAAEPVRVPVLRLKSPSSVHAISLSVCLSHARGSVPHFVLDQAVLAGLEVLVKAVGHVEDLLVLRGALAVVLAGRAHLVGVGVLQYLGDVHLLEEWESGGNRSVTPPR